MKTIGIGNTFPPSLIRRRTTFTPIVLDDMHRIIQGKNLQSFWGHANTIAAANAVLGFDVTPPTARRAVVLDNENYPTLDNVRLSAIIVCSPSYRPGYRPAEGAVSAETDIVGWQVLLVEF